MDPGWLADWAPAAAQSSGRPVSAPIGAPALIAARAVQGLGGAAVLPLSLTILTAAFPLMPCQLSRAADHPYGNLVSWFAWRHLVVTALVQSLDRRRRTDEPTAVRSGGRCAR
jgi:MFS family permease